MHNVRDYAVVTAAYWVFTLTDGALRMLVLLHLYGIGYSPLEIASLFVFYEFFGIVTNAVGGVLGARFGLKLTLFSGLALQIGACTMLATVAPTLPLVMVAQALSGVAKDLTKMSSKSYIKLVVPAGDRRGLLRWVTLLTGSKNTLKGLGFFLGGLLLSLLGFQHACTAMAAALAVTVITASLLLPSAPGKSKERATLRSLFGATGSVRWLAAARVFLFGSRDVWFVLGLPLYLSASRSWEHGEVSAFLALWIIGYGLVQVSAPAWLGSRSGHSLPLWTLGLMVPLGGILTAFALDAPPTASLIVGLSAFAFVFATNSAAHSYLIVQLAQHDRVALEVGFYYAANATGRLAGTVLSGLVFQAAGQGRDGLVACIATSIGFVVVAAVLSIPVRAAEQRC